MRSVVANAGQLARLTGDRRPPLVLSSSSSMARGYASLYRRRHTSSRSWSRATYVPYVLRTRAWRIHGPFALLARPHPHCTQIMFIVGRCRSTRAWNSCGGTDITPFRSVRVACWRTESLVLRSVHVVAKQQQRQQASVMSISMCVCGSDAHVQSMHGESGTETENMEF
jgi:hypothetical protein